MEFRVEDWYEIKSRRLIVAATKLDRETTDFKHLIGETVRLAPGPGDREFIEAVCVGVERYLHMPPWHEGESIGIAVKTADIKTTEAE